MLEKSYNLVNKYLKAAPLHKILRQLFSFNCKPPAPDNEIPVYFDDTTILWEKYKETLKDTTNLEELVKIQWQLFKVYENRLPDKNPNYLINVQLHAEMPIINIKHYNPYLFHLLFALDLQSRKEKHQY